LCFWNINLIVHASKGFNHVVWHILVHLDVNLNVQIPTTQLEISLFWKLLFPNQNLHASWNILFNYLGLILFLKFSAIFQSLYPLNPYIVAHAFIFYFGCYFKSNRNISGLLLHYTCVSIYYSKLFCWIWTK